MSITRKALSAMGIEAEKIEQIITMHADTVNALNEEIDKARAGAEKYKAEASKVAGLEKKLEEAKQDAETAKERGAEYEAIKAEFEEYRAEQERKAETARKETAFREWLKEMDVTDTGIRKILKWQGVDSVELDGNGKIANIKDLKKSVKEDWGEYIVTQDTQGADTPNPISNTGGQTRTKEEIMGIKDTAERQKAIAENHEVFGF